MAEFFGKYGSMILTLVVWAGAFYVMLILPNKKRQKKHQEMVDSLKEGTEVLTSGGIKGTIISTTEEYADIRVDKGVKLTVRKAAIATVLTK
ncbi:MAG: preprotein translocase subunit YajC [Fusobacteriaceae bacterium]|nr:preprotein translocase subunit YajC [Fusobacteriaceae bacterium]MBP6322950.1 preprotein translocase subunit YajC [Fusobacteriaceae bacterium]